MTDPRFIKRTAGLLAVLALASCFGESTGPEPVRSGRFSVAPVFDVRAIALVGFDSVRLHLTHLDGTTALDTTLFFPANVDTLTLDLHVPVTALTQQFLLSLVLVDSTGATVFTAGPDTVTASAGSPAPPVHPPLVYVGPGSHAAGVRFLGATPSSAFFQDTVTYVAEAFDSQGVTLPNTPIYWTSSDTLKARVLNKGAGVVVAGIQRGSATITAALLTSPPPVSRSLAVQPKPSAIAIQSGDAQSGSVGQPEGQQIVARVKALDGLGVQGIPVTFTPASGSVSKTVDTTDINGDARTTWTLGQSLGAQSLTASAQNVNPASVQFAANALAAAAKKLVFSVAPSNVNPGSSITPAVVVTAQDTFGNTATSFSGATAPVTVALAANPGGATLSGTTTVNAVNGVATFNNLSLNVPDTGYTLKATSGTLASVTSGAFAVNSSLPASLAITTQPTSTTAQTTMQAIQVTVKDAQGNVVTSDTATITAAISNNAGGGTLSGTTAVKAVAGVATFSNLQIDKAGTGYTLSFTRAGVTPAISNSFNINTGPAAALKFSVQPPASANFQSAFTTAVQTVDAGGNPVTSFSGFVTVGLGTNPAGGTLFGTVTIGLSSGVATFTTLDIDNIGNGYTLTASTGGLTSATSNAFNVGAPSGVNAWINTAGGNWGTASNWSKGTVPTASDTVAIAQSGNYTVNLDVNASPVALGVGAPLGHQVLSVGANVLTLSTTNVFTPTGKLSLSGGTIAGTGALTLLNGMDWSGGNLTFTGGISVTGPLTISGGGTRTWTGAAIVESGNSVWTGAGTFNSGLGASLTIATGGTLDIQGDPTWNNSQGGTASLNVLTGATLTRSTSTNPVNFFGVLNNAGAIAVNTGILSLNGSSASSGSYTVTSGATLSFGGVTHAIGGTLSVAGRVTAFSGTVNASAALTGSGAVVVQGGTVTFDGASMSIDTLIESSGVIGGAATGLVTANKVFSWTGGNITGTGGTIQVASVATGTLNPASTVTFSNMTLDLIGPTVWTGTSTISSGNGALILVRAGNTLDIQNAVNIQNNLGGTATHISNLGTITRSTTAGLAQVDVEVDNDGQITATAGILRLGNGSGAGTADGVYTSTSPATIEFFGGTHNLGAASSVNGTGIILIDGGTVNEAGTMSQTGPTQLTGGAFNFNGPASNIQSLLVGAGTFGGTGTLTVLGSFNWTSGNIAGSGGTIHMNASATTTINPTVSATFTNETVEIAGSGTWTGTGTINSGLGAVLRLQNGATMAITGDPSFVTNQGGTNTQLQVQSGAVLSRTTSANPAIMNVETDNDGQITVSSGTLRLGNGTGAGQSDGVFTANTGGTLEFSTSGTHTLSSLSTVNGTGTILVSGGTVNDAGTLAPAQLAVNGGVFNYNGASGTAPQLTLGGGTVGGTGLITVATTFVWASGNLAGAGGTVHVNSGGNATLNLVSAGTFTNEILEIAGSGIWQGAATVNTGLGAILRVQSGGSLAIVGDPTFTQNQGGTNTQLQVLSGGVLTRTTSTNVATMAVETDNDGQILVSSGTLRLAGNGTGAGASAGLYVVNNPAIIDFNAGTHTLSSTANVSGGGTALLSGATVNDAGAWSMTGTTQLTGGTLNYNGAGTGSTAALQLSSGTIGGTGLLTVSGAGTWSGGNISGGNGTLRILSGGGSLAINGATNGLLTAHVLEIGGTANWTTAFTINTGLGAILRTLSTGTLTISGNGSISQNQGGTTMVLDNQGTLTRTTSAGLVTFTGIIYQDTIGTTNVSTGTLLMNGGGRFATGAGKSVGSGASLVMNGGTYGFKQATAFTGLGRVADSSGATFTPDSNTATAPTTNALSFTNFDLAGGILAHEGLVQVSGTMNWSGGNITSNANGLGGTTRILASGNLNIIGTSNRTFTGTHLLEMLGSNNTWTAGPAMFINTGVGAVMRVQSGATLNVSGNNPTISLNQGGTATFDNLGSVNRSGTANWVVNVPVTGNGSWTVSSPATLDVQCGGGSNACSFTGPTTVNSGATLVQNAGIITYTSASSITGAGTIQVNSGTFNSQGPMTIGTLTVGSGAGVFNMGGNTVNVTGNFATSGSGTFNEQTATNNDSLNVTGNVTFGGALGTTSAGVIRLLGNFIETGSANFKGTALSAAVAHRVRFDAGGLQTVTFADPTNAFFRRVILNKGTSGFQLSTDARTTFLGGTWQTISGLAGPPITRLFVDTLAGVSGSGSVSTPLTVQVGGVVTTAGVIADSGVVNVDTLIYGGANQSIRTSGIGGPGTITYKSIRVTQSAGTATFNQATSLANDLNVTSGSVSLNGFHVTVAGNFGTSGTGTLTMQNAADSLGVGGTATFAGNSTTGLLTAGILDLKGNFSQVGSVSPASFAPSTAHRTRFDLPGSAVIQTISFATPTTSFFDSLITDRGVGTRGTIQFLTDATINRGWTLQNSTDITGSTAHVNVAAPGVLHSLISTTSPTLQMSSLALGASPSVTLAGGLSPDTTILGYSGLIQLTGFNFKSIRVANSVSLAASSTLTLAADLIADGASAVFSTNGSSTTNVGGRLVTSNGGKLNFVNASDNINVTGDAIFAGGQSTLSGGTLKLAGNFSQSGGNSAAFQATPGFITEFNNTSRKTVLLLNFGPGATNSRFGVVHLFHSGGPAVIALQSSIQAAMIVDSSLGTADSIIGTTTGITVTADSAAGQGLNNTVFNNAVLVLNSGTATMSLNTIKFISMDPTTTFLTMSRGPGAQVTINGMNFASAHTTGHYFAANTTGPGGPGIFTFPTGSLPASFTAAAGDYTRAGPTLPTVNWNGTANP